jgi:hypothetical protein
MTDDERLEVEAQDTCDPEDVATPFDPEEVADE